VVVPAAELRDLVVVEADLALGELEVLLDRPAQAAIRSASLVYRAMPVKTSGVCT
jgi:hypothetical protein